MRRRIAKWLVHQVLGHDWVWIAADGTGTIFRSKCVYCGRRKENVTPTFNRGEWNVRQSP